MDYIMTISVYNVCIYIYITIFVLNSQIFTDRDENVIILNID